MRVRAALMLGALLVVSTASMVFGQGFQGGVRGAVKDAGIKFPSSHEAIPLNQRCIFQSGAIDVHQGDLTRTAEAHQAVRHRHKAFSQETAGDHHGDDALVSGIHNNIGNVAGIGAVGGMQGYIVLAYLERAVVGGSGRGGCLSGRLGVKAGDPVVVRSRSAELRGTAEPGPCRAQHAQGYWPECNVLLEPRYDPESGEPDYNAVVSIERSP